MLYLRAVSRYFVDGVEVPLDQFVVPADDPGFTRGLNAFETVRTYGRRIFRLDAHLDRLFTSVEAMEVIPAPPREVLRHELLEAARDVTAQQPLTLRLTLTGGGRRLLQVEPLDLSRVHAPIRVVTRRYEPPAWLDGRIKHGSRAVNVVACSKAGVDEIIWVGHDGCITEATRSSIFGVVDNVLWTPPLDARILSGVTRAALLEAAAEANIPFAVRTLPAGSAFTELYATSTLKEIAPIAEIDGRPGPAFSSGHADGFGPVGAALKRAMAVLTARA